MQLTNKISKITTGFQITIPANYRKDNKLNIGDYVCFRQDHNKLIIEPIERIDEKRQNALTAFNDLFKEEVYDKNFSKLSEEEVMKAVNKEIKLSRKKK